MMQVPGLGVSVRAAAGPADWRPHRHFRARILANALPLWALLPAPLSLVVRDPDQTPYCAGSLDPLLSRLLTEQWPLATIIDALP